jgi:hypothetical protein
MPLTRKIDRTLTTMLGVKFLMQDGDAEVPCRADRELLRHRFGSRDRDSDAAVFETHRTEIEQAASDIYDAGKVEPHSDAAVVVREDDLASSLSRKLNMPAALCLAVIACLSAPQLVVAQQATPAPMKAERQVVPLSADALYRGWRSSRILGADVVSKTGDEFAIVRNILVGHNGQIEALIVEHSASSMGPEFVHRIPWNRIELGMLPGKVVADISPRGGQQYPLFAGKERPNEFPVSEVVGDYARLQAGFAYGYVSDVVFDGSGRLQAVLVTRDAAAGGGTFAFGFPDTTGRWNPAVGYYGLPYKTVEQASAAAIRVDPVRFGGEARRSGGSG